MRRRLLAPFLICVTLLAQTIAPISAAARMETAARGVACKKHAQHAPPGADSTAPAQKTGAGHDHASCAFCQLGAAAVPDIALVAVAMRRSVRRSALPPAAVAPPAVAYNRNAPARAPPFLV